MFALLAFFIFFTSPALAQEAPEEPAAPTEVQEEEAFNPPEEEILFYDAAHLQGMNKVTARVSGIEAPIGSAAHFGNLEIIVRACWKAPPEARPESAALLEIWDMKPGESPEKIFLGWMFASSPGLSALEHPVYDITVLDCRKKALLPDQ